MEEKLKEILDNYETDISRYENYVNELTSKIDFCKAHNFDEEARIAQIKYDALNMVIYRWRAMKKEINELLNEWNS